MFSRYVLHIRHLRERRRQIGRPTDAATGAYRHLPQNATTGAYRRLPQNATTGAYRRLPQNAATDGDRLPATQCGERVADGKLPEQGDEPGEKDDRADDGGGDRE